MQIRRVDIAVGRRGAGRQLGKAGGDRGLAGAPLATDNDQLAGALRGRIGSTGARRPTRRPHARLDQICTYRTG